MNIHEWLDAEIRRVVAAQTYREESTPGAEIDDFDHTQAAEALSYIEAHKRAVIEVQGWLKDALAQLIGDGRNMRYGDVVFRVRPKRKLTVTDSKAFAKVLGDRVADVFRLDGSNLRKTALKAAADDLDLDEQTLWDTFIESEDGDLELAQVPANRAPKFLDDLEDGEIR